MGAIATVLQANNHPMLPLMPDISFGEDDPDGAGYPLKNKVVGSHYWQKVGDGHVRQYIKVKDENADHDWVLLKGIMRETVNLSDFTDSGGTTGTYTMTVGSIPAGAWYQYTSIEVTSAFANVSDTDIGDGSTPARYNKSSGASPTNAVSASVDLGQPSGTRHHDTAVTPVITLTHATSFSLITGGTMVVTLVYEGSN